MTAPNGGNRELAVRARGLAKSFRGGLLGRRPVRAVTDATFDVQRGEMFALIGPNGAGKSSTLRMLAGLVLPTAGSVEIGGLAPAAAAGRGQIGYLSDAPALYEHLTPEGLFALAATLSALPRPAGRARAEELVGRLGLEGARGRPARRLSKGTRQRLALALALLASPPVLLLDEPMSGLDPLMHASTRALLAELRAGGTTIILSTHALVDVEESCDRVAIMVGGRVRRVDRPRAQPLAQALAREVADAAAEAAAP